MTNSDRDTNADALTMLAGVQLTLLGVFIAVAFPRSSGITPLGVVVLGTVVAAYGWYPS